jgi:acyl-CoA dehydrogenase
MAVRRNIFVTAAIALADKTLELAGGAGFYRSAGLERCFRDLQGARFHPIPEKVQTRMTGRLLLGLDLG